MFLYSFLIAKTWIYRKLANLELKTNRVGNELDFHILRHITLYEDYDEYLFVLRYPKKYWLALIVVPKSTTHKKFV